jgi:hypothetical protein
MYQFLGTSGGASKPGGVQRKNLTNKQSSLLGIKKTSTGTVSKPVHRKSLDPKLIAGSTGKSPYFGSTKYVQISFIRRFMSSYLICYNLFKFRHQELKFW